MTKNIVASSPLDQAHRKATLLGLLFEKHDIKLSRAQQLESLAYLEGAASWHVLAAQLSAAPKPPFGTPVRAHQLDGLKTWRVKVVLLDTDCRLAGELFFSDANRNLPDSARAEVRRLRAQLERVFVPKKQLVVYVDGVLGLLLEQEVVSDDDVYEEAGEERIARLCRQLLPLLEPTLTSFKSGARSAMVNDSDFVWNGQPTCWVFLPLETATREQCSMVVSIQQQFVYEKRAP